MQVFKNSGRLFKQTNLSRKYFSTLPFEASAFNGFQNAIRFENQNRIWTFDELTLHSNAFAYGLVELGYKPGDKLLVLTDSNSTAEIVGAQVGAGKAGVTIVNSFASNASQLEKDIKDANPVGILYSPNTLASENTRNSDLIQQVIPELEGNGNQGRQLKSSKFSNLRYVVHTGFYTQPGQYKYRDVLVYASKNFNTLSLPKADSKLPLIVQNNKAHTVSELVQLNEKLRGSNDIKNNTVFVTGDARYPASFALGALNALLHGNYTVYTGRMEQAKVDTVLDLHNNAVLLNESVLSQ